MHRPAVLSAQHLQIKQYLPDGNTPATDGILASMRKAIGVLAIIAVFVMAAYPGRAAETTVEYSVQLSVSVQTDPPAIRLSWPQDHCTVPTGYEIYRKSPDGSWWGQASWLPGRTTTYLDTNIAVGTAYEYQVVKNTPRYNGYGYICAGIQLPIVENRGKLLLVVDKTYEQELSDELAQLEEDLRGDGWLVTRLDVNRTDSVVEVKARIKAEYNADPTHVNCVFLFGHVPVPYSGNIVPDGHAPDHQGAWPCDGFYGDMDGTWTDTSVDVEIASDPRNRNVPGDGKFDQSTFPAPLRLMVGRVDLANMPGRLCAGGPATFPSELDLLRNYLAKDHKFRMRQFNLPRRGIVGDYFGVRDGEAFAASGWRNFATFFKPAEVTTLPEERTWIRCMATNRCLWAYGCGPGTYTSIGGLGTADTYNDGVTTDIVKADIKSVFTMLFGSWLGDWDSEDDFQRAVLATPSYGLTCSWSGRPHWFMHHMALGAPIGYSARLTQNNRRDGLYHNQQNNGAAQIHIALMGDPTLRMHVVAPPVDLVATRDGAAVELEWEAADDSVIGYYIYRSRNPNDPFIRLTSAPISGTSFTDAHAELASTYLVRSLKLEQSGSGSYYNLSQGAFITVPGEAPVPTIAPLASRTEPGQYTAASHLSALAVSLTNSIPESTGRGPTPASPVN